VHAGDEAAVVVPIAIVLMPFPGAGFAGVLHDHFCAVEVDFGFVGMGACRGAELMGQFIRSCREVKRGSKGARLGRPLQMRENPERGGASPARTKAGKRNKAACPSQRSLKAGSRAYTVHVGQLRMLDSLGSSEVDQPPPRALMRRTLASMRRRWMSTLLRSFWRAMVWALMTWR
jgi:hypothetical protein